MKNNKCTGLLFNVVLLLSSLMIGSLFAQSISKPSIPEFTAKIITNNIEITVKNQPLTPYENGSYPNLYYMFRFKDHNAEEGFWDYDPEYFVLPSTYGGYYEASNSEFTVVSLSIKDHHFPSGQIDIQAIALVGNQYPTDMQNGTVYGFEGEISGWSNYQTLTINEIPLSFWIVIVLIIIAVVVVVTQKYRRSNRQGRKNEEK